MLGFYLALIDQPNEKNHGNNAVNGSTTIKL